MTTTKIYLNEGQDHFFGFHNEFADAPALRLAATFELPAALVTQLTSGQPITALETVFEQLNIGGEPGYPAEPWTTEYRSHRNRSLSTGDVVVLGENAYAVASFGWDHVPTADLLTAIDRATS